MTFLRSVLFNLLSVLWTAGIGLFALPILFLARSRLGSVADFWTRGLLLLARLCCGIRHRMLGAQHRPAAAIYASKHQSAWETLALWLLLDRPVFVLKKELLHLPIFGNYLKRVPHIAIDRSGGGSAIKQLVAQSRTHLEAGRRIVIFPEGTRTAPGEHLEYRSGIATLYRQLKTPVVPVALNSGLYWGRNAFTKRAGTITIEFLEPIAPGLEKEAFMAQLEQTIEETSAGLLEFRA